ncbi:MAG: hypothetical protein ACAH59_01955 [Pseudobdellovibrionaceae bacterium]
MKKTVMSLFRYQIQIDEAFHELLKIGFSPSHMKSFSTIGNHRVGYKIATIGSDPDDRYADQKSELFQMLLRFGCPQDDALLFAEGVRRGGKLAIVIARNTEVDLIARIFKKHEALDLQSRKKFGEERRLGPLKGLSDSPFTKITQVSTYSNDLADWVLAHQTELASSVRVKVFDKPIEIEDKKLERNLNE